jgi:hypothetical protein
MNKEAKNLLFFYGIDCPHCVDTEKCVDRLVGEGLDIKKVEVYQNKENDKWLMELDVGENICGGVPFFLNQHTGKTICGEVTYRQIKNWAEGK